MKIDLIGKSALVTGSTAGIGFAIAASLAGAGAQVYINGRSQKTVDEAIRKMKAKFPEARVDSAVGDLSTLKGCEPIFSKVKEVDILINNAGIFEPKEFFDIPDSDWQRFFEVNVMSAIRMSRHYTPKMVAKKWGRVVFISSESGFNIPKEMVHYGMTKTAMLSVARGLAETVAGTGVTVNSVLPGPTKTEGVMEFVGKLGSGKDQTFEQQEAEFFRTARPTSLIRRFATPEEVANLVTYVSSPLASATTGASLRVDGGVIQTI